MEIGAFTRPIPGIRPTYVDRFATYADQATLADYFGDACDLPYYDDSLDFVASSHVTSNMLQIRSRRFVSGCECFDTAATFTWSSQTAATLLIVRVSLPKRHTCLPTFAVV